MKLLQLYRLGEESVSDLKESFDNLPHTNHKDGKYRLRRYSVIEFGVDVRRLVHREFEQSEELNEHQGGVKRDFEEIEEGVLQSEGMEKICLAFGEANNLVDGQEIEIHQMRVVTQDDGQAEASPEGTHQDGFDYIAMVGVNRQNISGGELLVYEGRDTEPFLTYALKSGEMIMLNDRKMWHNATLVKAMNRVGQGCGDWFILCARTLDNPAK